MKGQDSVPERRKDAARAHDTAPEWRCSDGHLRGRRVNRDLRPFLGSLLLPYGFI
jgi:hypothetical protein